jgi:NADPH-dependent 7-cyano-7-deazaguanine reductase QueF
VAKVQPRSMKVVGDFNIRGGLKSVITAGYAKK